MGLTQTLSHLGWSAHPSKQGLYKKAIYDQNGLLVGHLNAGEVWALLRHHKLIP